MKTSYPTVAHLVISLEIGGLENLVCQWAKARHEQSPGSTYVYCLDAPGALMEELPAPMCRCFQAKRSRRPFDRTCVSTLRQALYQDGVQVLHSHNLSAFHYAALGTICHSARHLYTQHGAYYDISLTGRLKQRLLAAWGTDRMVAVSKDTAAKMTRLQGLPAGDIQVVPNGISPHPQGPAPDLGLPPDAIVLGSLGGLRQVKAWDRFLPVAAEIMAEQPAVHLLLIGDGPERAAIEAQAKALAIDDRLIITGYRTDARRYLDLMDIFVLPSYSEGMSMALLEAMAAGLPVLVTDVGDSAELVEAAGCGRVLSNDPTCWPAEIQAFLDCTRTQPTIGRRGRDFVLSTYTMTRTLTTYEQLYHELSS